jgi:hypothetical protein
MSGISCDLMERSMKRDDIVEAAGRCLICGSKDHVFPLVYSAEGEQCRSVLICENCVNEEDEESAAP